LGLGVHVRGADLHHVDVEQRLDGLANLRLVRLVVHAEGVLAGLGEREGLLGQDRPDDHLGWVHYAALPSSLDAGDSAPAESPTESAPADFARACNACSAASDTSSDAAPTMSATPASCTGSA